MQATLISLAVASILLLIIASSAQERTNHNKHMMLMEILKDSIMTDLMMDHIASDKQTHSMMVDRLIYYAVGDTPKMKDICSKILDQKAMRSVMLEMLDEKANK